MAINFLNTVAVDENVLFVDAVNDRVGVGTASPDQKLQIEFANTDTSFSGGAGGDWGSEGIRIENTLNTVDTMAILHLRNNDADIHIAGIRQGSNDSDLGLFFEGIEKVRFTNNGNVGIGTSSPDYLLDLYKSTATTSSSTGTTLQRLWNYVGSDLNQQKTFIDFVFQDDNDNEYPQVRIGAEVGQNGDSDTQPKEGSGAFVVYTNNATGNGPGTPTGLAERFRVDYKGYVGIGTTNPGSKLTVSSGVTDPSVNTVRFNHVRDNADVATQAMIIDMNLSGADTTTADRTNSGIVVDVDSSANGDASNEHRIRGITSDVRFTGFSDSVQAGYFYSESNNTTQKTAQIIGVQGQAVHDSDSVDGGVSNMYGVYGVSSIQDLGDVDNAYGGFFLTTVTPGRGADVGVTKGVEGKVSIDKAETINYGPMMAVSGIIDNNEGAVPVFENQYLFKGDYQGEKGSNAYGIYTEGDKHYFEGNIGIGTPTPTYKLDVLGSANNADIGIRINNSFDDNDPTSEPNAVLFLNAASNNGYLRVHGAPANTAAKHQIDLGSTAATSFLTFSPSGAEAMRIDSSGNVGIGTDSPGEKLDINGNVKIKDALFSNQENTNIDSAAAEVVAQVAHATYTAAFFDFVVKKGANVRSGTVYACHNGDTTPLVEFTETSTNDLGDTSDVTLSVDISGANMRLLATVTSDDWSVKSLIRAI